MRKNNRDTSRKTNYRSTVAACYIGYIAQAASVNLAPLLFVIFNTRFDLSLDKIGLLVCLGFITQIFTDFIASRLVPAVGYRICAVAAHFLCAAGLVLLGVLPLVMPVFPALIAAYVVTALGGGLLEVLISPVVDSVPAKSKAGAMSLLHSFYCWGVVAVVLLTTLMDLLLPDEFWYVIPVVWTALPLCNGLLFLAVPLPAVEGERDKSRPLLKNAAFWLMGALMLASGAAEQSMSQWASLFAETALGIPKAVGDILGMGAFAALMGVSRLVYGIFGKRLKLKLTLTVCAAVNFGAYMLTVFSPTAAGSLIGCALCGLSVGMAWPGALSLAAERVPKGGAAIFAFMALFGDIGCALGPGLVGWVSGAGLPIGGSPLKAGLLAAAAFPVILFFVLLFVRKRPEGELPLQKPAA